MSKELIVAKNDTEAVKAPVRPPKWEDNMLEEIFERTKKGDKFPHLLDIAADAEMDTIIESEDIPALQKEIASSTKLELSEKTKAALQELLKVSESAVKEKKKLYFLV